MIRRIVYFVILALSIFFVARNHDELTIILRTLGRGNPGWLLLAVAAQVLWLVAIAGNLRSAYALTGMHEKIGHMTVLTAAANFINVIAPSYGAGAVAVFIADGQRRAKPAGKVTTASFLYLVYDYLGLMIVLAIGFILLNQRELLSTAIIGAATFVYAIGIGLILLTVVGVSSADRLDRVVVWLVSNLNRLLHPVVKRILINIEEARKFGADLAGGLGEIRRSPGNLLQPLAWALGRKAMMIVILFIISLAYDEPFDLPTSMVSFTVSYLFTIVSVTPSGVGFVEGAMSLIQIAMGVDPATSVAIAVAYRGLTFWLVLLYGFAAVRVIDYSFGPS